MAKLKDKTGRIRTYGVDRIKRSFRIRSDLWARLKKELAHTNDYMTNLLGTVLDEGLKVLESKRKGKR